MKKIFSALLVLGLSFSLVGCSSNAASGDEVNLTLEIVSERDNVDTTTDYTTTSTTLGDFLIEENLVDYETSEYGMFIHGIDGMADDASEEYWWNIAVDGESAISGADSIELADGSTYTLTLMQGY